MIAGIRDRQGVTDHRPTLVSMSRGWLYPEAQEGDKV